MAFSSSSSLFSLPDFPSPNSSSSSSSIFGSVSSSPSANSGDSSIPSSSLPFKTKTSMVASSAPPFGVSLSGFPSNSFSFPTSTSASTTSATTSQSLFSNFPASSFSPSSPAFDSSPFAVSSSRSTTDSTIATPISFFSGSHSAFSASASPFGSSPSPFLSSSSPFSSSASPFGTLSSPQSVSSASAVFSFRPASTFLPNNGTGNLPTANIFPSSFSAALSSSSSSSFSFGAPSSSGLQSSIGLGNVVHVSATSNTAASTSSVPAGSTTIPAASSAGSVSSSAVATTATTLAAPLSTAPTVSFSSPDAKSPATFPPQSTALFGTRFSFGESMDDEDERVASDGEQVRDSVDKPVVQNVESEAKIEEVKDLKQDIDVKSNGVTMEGVQQSTESGVTPSTNTGIEEVWSNTGSSESNVAAKDLGATQPNNMLEEGPEDPCDNISSASESISGDELRVHRDGRQTPLMSLCADVNGFTPSSVNSSILKQILAKYGDITEGSILKSAAAKSSFLQLVADVVHRLCSHTLETLGSDEMQLMQTKTADAVAVKFRVDWLQQRVNKVTTAFKYQVRTIELDELGQQIDAAKKSLMEMELRQMVWKKEVAFMKSEIKGNDLNGSNLGDDLL